MISPSESKAGSKVIRETRRLHLLLGPMHRVRNSLQLHPTLLIVKQQIAGVWISVPRLAHGSHIDDVAKACLEMNSRVSALLTLPLLVLDEKEGQMRMSHKADPAGKVRKGLLGFLYREYVFPHLGFFRGGVDKKKPSVAWRRGSCARYSASLSESRSLVQRRAAWAKGLK
jgi:hypothetical protein